MTEMIRGSYGILPLSKLDFRDPKDMSTPQERYVRSMTSGPRMANHHTRCVTGSAPRSSIGTARTVAFTDVRVQTATSMDAIKRTRFGFSDHATRSTNSTCVPTSYDLPPIRSSTSRPTTSRRQPRDPLAQTGVGMAITGSVSESITDGEAAIQYTDHAGTLRGLRRRPTYAKVGMGTFDDMQHVTTPYGPARVHYVATPKPEVPDGRDWERSLLMSRGEGRYTRNLRTTYATNGRLTSFF
eukprot:m.266721 g.266721  ORF g.266721 m.266721 type:complete len:241 (-) comp19722_c1_seq1:199-921(-)